MCFHKEPGVQTFYYDVCGLSRITGTLFQYVEHKSTFPATYTESDKFLGRCFKTSVKTRKKIFSDLL